MELCPLINVFKVISIPGVFCFSPPVNTCFTAYKLFSVLQDGASVSDFNVELCFHVVFFDIIKSCRLSLK